MLTPGLSRHSSDFVDDLKSSSKKNAETTTAPSMVDVRLNTAL
jgi:hypothetical protein